MPSFSASLGVLRKRNVARYVAANAISSLGGGAATVALAFAVLEIGDFSDLGLVFLVREIPMVVLLLLGGVWADRVSRKAILVSCDVIRAGAQTATAVLLLTGHAAVWSVAVAQIAFGMAAAFSRPAQVGIIKEIVAAAQLQQANALLSLARSLSLVAGPALGALIVEFTSPGIGLAVDATTFAVSAVLIAGVRLASTRVAMARASILVDLREGWSEFVSQSWVWLMVVSFGLFQFSYFPALLVLGPTVSKEEFGGAGAWGAILAVGAVGSIGGGVLALRLHFSRPLVAMAAMTLLPGLLLLSLAAPAPVVVVAAASLVASGALGLTDPVWFATVQKNVPEHALSRIASFDWFGSVALNPIGYALIGPVASSIGVGRTLALSGGINIATSVGLLALRPIRALRDGDSAPEAR